jgi:hypothetical protein
MDRKQISEIRSFLWESSRTENKNDRLAKAVQYLRLLLDSNIAMQRKMFRLRQKLREEGGGKND